MKKSILGIVFISFLVTGCSPIFYTPNTQNVPMISKNKGVPVFEEKKLVNFLE